MIQINMSQHTEVTYWKALMLLRSTSVLFRHLDNIIYISNTTKTTLATSINIMKDDQILYTPNVMSIFFSVIAMASVVNGLVAICRKKRQDINKERTSTKRLVLLF